MSNNNLVGRDSDVLVNDEKTIYNSEVGMSVVHTPSDTNKYLCRVRFDFDGKTYVLEDVGITALMLWKFNNRDECNFAKTYRCMLDSDDWKAMPFQLIRYGNTEDVRYLIQCVEIRKVEKSDVVLPTGDVIVNYTNRYYKRSQYMRYRDYLSK